MPKEQKSKSLFKDIGKSTLRGVRKCPKCGTSNGMRGFSCKNRSCDVVFKEAGEKRKLSTDVCKVITCWTHSQLYSVRVRDKGPDYRGFVQMPLLQPSLRESQIPQSTTLCFVDSCQRTFTTNILKCHEKEIPVESICQHIQATFRCYAEGQPLLINNAMLFSMNFPLQIKESIWKMTLESIGPTVQRISKSVFVVKCKVTSKHPLGYLHVTFNLGNQTHYSCSCPSFKGLSKNMKNFGRCIHYYACMAAFACNDDISEEFAYFVNHERTIMDLTRPKRAETIAAIDDEEGNQNQLVAILSDVVNNCDVKVQEEAELLERYTLADGIPQDEDFGTMTETEMTTEVMSDLDLQSLEVVCPESEITTLIINQNSFDPDILKNNCGRQLSIETNEVCVSSKGSPKKKKDETDVPQTRRQGNSTRKPRKTRTTIVLPSEVKSFCINESTIQQPFINWLSSVTERINQTMHFQFSGKPASLVFHTPQEFFECLRERISGGFKKRLPNSTISFVRKHAVPIGTFTKYTWAITNIIHCKQIFETPMMPLEITRSFVQNRDGSYEPFVGSSLQDEAFSKLDKGPRIKPLELKTFLKVGRTTPDQKLPTPLIIEWIPDILPVSKVGELKITFEYGHQKP